MRLPTQEVQLPPGTLLRPDERGRPRESDRDEYEARDRGSGSPKLVERPDCTEEVETVEKEDRDG
jgi:hypothetical protein